MQDKKLITNTPIVLGLIILAIASRLIPHPANFAPILSIGIFGAALFKDTKWAYLIPVIATWLSDVFINNFIYGQYYPEFTWFYGGFYWQYGIYILIPFLARFIFSNRITGTKILLSSLGSGIIFFLISNFGVWLGSKYYSQDLAGLIFCYERGLPFLKGTMYGNLFYSAVLFGTYYIIERQIPSLRYNSKFALR